MFYHSAVFGDLLKIPCAVYFLLVCFGMKGLVYGTDSNLAYQADVATSILPDQPDQCRIPTI